MKEVKRKFGAFMIPRQNQNPGPRPGQIKQGLHQIIQDFPGNIILVKKIPAVQEQIGFNFPGMFEDGQKIFVKVIRPPFPPQGVGLLDPGDVEAEMGICRVNEFQGCTKRVFWVDN